MDREKQLKVEDYTVGWICALDDIRRKMPLDEFGRMPPVSRSRDILGGSWRKTVNR